MNRSRFVKTRPALTTTALVLFTTSTTSTKIFWTSRRKERMKMTSLALNKNLLILKMSAIQLNYKLQSKESTLKQVKNLLHFLKHVFKPQTTFCIRSFFHFDAPE